MKPWLGSQKKNTAQHSMTCVGIMCFSTVARPLHARSHKSFEKLTERWSGNLRIYS